MSEETKTSKRTNAAMKMEMAEDYITQKYEFIYNVIKGMPEYRERGKDEYIPIDDYKLNSLKRELIATLDMSYSTVFIKELISGDFAPMVDPIRRYFDKLPGWDTTDHIKQLADTVKVTNPKRWYEYLKKWLVASVANSLIPQGCQNHTCLTLTGGQGKFKTTWLDILLPDPLFDYGFTGKIDPNNKDSQTLLAECFLINIDDQLRQLNKKDENDLKELITKPYVKYRRPYDKFIKGYPRIANFCASVNGSDFLTDSTGSRRFLPFEVHHIDIKRAQEISIDQVWAQALYLYKQQTFRYWFNEQEVEELNNENRDFQVITLEEQLILEYFDKPQNLNGNTKMWQTARIQTHLETKTKTRLSLKKIGEALNSLGYEKRQKVLTSGTRPTWVWPVLIKDPEGYEPPVYDSPY